MGKIRSRILTFAIVQQGFGGHRDLISTLGPFLAPIAEDLNGRIFDASTFRAEMQSRYGIALSRDVTEVFVQRLIKLNFLKRSGDGLYWTRQPTDISDKGDAANKRLEELSALAAQFYADRVDLVSEKYNEENFFEALLSVLLDQNSALRAAVSAIEAATGVETGNEAPLPRSVHEYYASEFIGWTAKNRKDVFEWLAELSGTALVSEALIEVRTPSSNGTIKPDLTVYLDTPVLMEVLGCSGAAAHEDSTLLVSTLQSQRISVCVIRHSLDELKRNISAVLRLPADKRVGPTAKALLYREVTEAYLGSVLSHPEHFIRESGLQIVDPAQHGHLLDEKCFTNEDALNFYAMIFSLHDRDEPRQHDVDSITWIMRRRRNETSSDILRAKHILLTRNDQLVRSANRIAAERAHYPSGTWGPAISARDLAGVLWMIVGQPQRTEMSKRQLILSCDRARSSAPQIISGMLNTLQSVDPRNAALLWVAVQKPAYLSMALDAAAASSQIGASEAVTLTLAKIREDLIADERAATANKLAREREKFDAEAQLAKTVITSLENDKDTAERKAEDLIARFRQLSDQEWQKIRRMAQVVYWLGRGCVHSLMAMVIIFAAVFGTEAVAVHWGVKAVVGAIAGLAALYFSDAKVRQFLCRKIEEHFRPLYERRIRQLVGDEVAKEVLIMEHFIKCFG